MLRPGESLAASHFQLRLLPPGSILICRRVLLKLLPVLPMRGCMKKFDTID